MYYHPNRKSCEETSRLENAYLLARFFALSLTHETIVRFTTTMLASVFVLVLAVIDAAVASDSQCKPNQLGKYAKLSTDRATQKYCAALLHGKAPRHLGQDLAERSGKTDIEW